jgi:flavin-dependent dehydrogenase
VRRADFDRILWDAALATGLDARDETTAESVLFEGARATGVRSAPGPTGAAPTCARGSSPTARGAPR